MVVPCSLFIYHCSCCPNLLILLFSFLYYAVELLKLTFNSSASQLEKEQRLSKLTKYQDWNPRGIFLTVIISNSHD